MNHGNPYLKLGPFKYELKSAEPEIAIVHQLISIQEAESVKELARNKMRSTPYIDGGKDKSFSKGRTSKVMYMNEKLVPEADAVSKKIRSFLLINFNRISAPLDSQTDCQASKFLAECL